MGSLRKFCARQTVIVAVLCFGVGGFLQAGGQNQGILTPHQHGRARFRHLRSDGTADAYNWAGYAVAAATPPATETSPTGVQVTSVTGSWVVPVVDCSGKSTQYASFWVGIDGWYSPTVEQIGTDSDCSSGTPSYYAWYEFYPESSYYTCPPSTGHGHSAPPCPLMSLKVGDTISASVNCTPGGACTATITDQSMSPPASFSTTYTATRKTGIPQLSSAEWIAEAPCCSRNGGVLPLANFNAVYMGRDATYNGNQAVTGVAGTNAAVVNGVNGSISSFYGASPATWWVCTMVNQNYTFPDGGVNPPNPPPPGDIMAQPSPLSASGAGFSVQWSSVGP